MRPYTIWNAGATAVREVLAAVGVGGREIAAVGLTRNMIGAWLVDGAGERVRRCHSAE